MLIQKNKIFKNVKMKKVKLFRFQMSTIENKSVILYLTCFRFCPQCKKKICGQLKNSYLQYYTIGYS